MAVCLNKACSKNIDDTGAILAIGRGGRETTLWPKQKWFFDKKFVICWLQTNTRQGFMQSFVQNTADQVLEEASGLFLSVSSENGLKNMSQCNVEGSYAHP